jgi:hypothetical protein
MTRDHACDVERGADGNLVLVHVDDGFAVDLDVDSVPSPHNHTVRARLTVSLARLD